MHTQEKAHVHKRLRSRRPNPCQRATFDFCTSHRCCSKTTRFWFMVFQTPKAIVVEKAGTYMLAGTKKMSGCCRHRRYTALLLPLVAHCGVRTNSALSTDRFEMEERFEIPSRAEEPKSPKKGIEIAQRRLPAGTVGPGLPSTVP